MKMTTEEKTQVLQTLTRAVWASLDETLDHFGHQDKMVMMSNTLINALVLIGQSSEDPMKFLDQMCAMYKSGIELIDDLKSKRA